MESLVKTTPTSLAPDRVSGLLYSQIGYDLNAPMRALLRNTDRSAYPEGATFRLQNAATGETVLLQPIAYWGECWGSHWWVADFSSLAQPGEYSLTIDAEGAPVAASQSFRVGEYLLWQETVRPVGIEQFEQRARLARYGKGWKDCGSDWREVGSHTAALIGLLDLLNIGYEWLGQEDTRRLVEQIIHGCDFIVACQQRAHRLGYPEGAILHEMPNYPALIPQDQGQSVVALARAARHIYEIDPERGMDYLSRAAKAYEYLVQRCRPSAPQHFSALNHGAPHGYVPSGFMTGDLLMMAWGGVELAISGRAEYKNEAIRCLREVLARQVKKEAPEGELYGHFYTFADRLFTEKAFVHHHVGHDTSMMFAHYLVPLIEVCRQWPGEPEAPPWRQALHDFAYGYFLPACRKNPFYLLPEGYFNGQGLLTFAGPWHGFNVCYGYAAALAAQLELFFGDRQFREIAAGNLQWIAGLNAGITRQAFEGSVFWREDIPEGEALPYSHIYGLGHRFTGCWSGIRGSLGNGFCTNRQFELAVEPTLANDGPWRYSDEDWIPHAGGWVSGLAHLKLTMLYRK